MQFRLHPRDFCVPAGNVLLEACHERPRSMGAERLNPTMRLLLAVTHQWAALWRPLNNLARNRLKVLSFAGTPKNRKRLTSNGFQASGKKMKSTAVESM